MIAMNEISGTKKPRIKRGFFLCGGFVLKT
jgi:hypothetical protein